MQIAARAGLDAAGAAAPAEDPLDEAPAAAAGAQRAAAPASSGLARLRGLAHVQASLGLEPRLRHNAHQQLVHVQADSRRRLGELALVRGGRRLSLCGEISVTGRKTSPRKGPLITSSLRDPRPAPIRAEARRECAAADACMLASRRAHCARHQTLEGAKRRALH